MNRRILHNETLPIMTEDEKKNVENVYYCLIHNGCLQMADTYEKEGIRKCRIHGCSVNDVTNSVLGRAFRDMVHLYPRE